MEVVQYLINTMDEWEIVAHKLLSYDFNPTIILFNGDLGSGKTTLIQSITKHLDVVDDVLSPTFSIANEYKSKSNYTLFHLDLYRLNNIEELLDIDIERYLFDGKYCFIEWPTLALSFLGNTPFITVNIIKNNENSRTVTIEVVHR